MHFLLADLSVYWIDCCHYLTPHGQHIEGGLLCLYKTLGRGSGGPGSTGDGV